MNIRIKTLTPIWTGDVDRKIGYNKCNDNINFQ